MLYIIIQHGVYIRGIYGIFTDLEIAKKHADLCAETDTDSYHEYQVIEYKKNEPIYHDDPSHWYGLPPEVKPLYSTRKSDA